MFGEEKQELYGANTLYRELGCFQNKRKKYRECAPAFDKAVELTPTDLRALLGRSWARAKNSYFTCAIEDMNTALKKNKGNLVALQHKALYTYFRTDFEKAMVMNLKGSQKRKFPPLFVIGAMECTEEVERTVGKRGGHALRDHYDVIRTIAWKKAIDLKKGKQWKPQFKKRKRKSKLADNTPPLYIKFMKKIKHDLQQGVSELSILESLTDYSNNDYYITKKKKSAYQPPQARTTNVDNMISEKYLGKMCYDKRCLRDIKNDPRIRSPNLEGTLNIRTLSRKGHRAIAYRQELLRIRQPFYSIKYSEAEAKGEFLKRQQAELLKVQNIARNASENLIKLLRAAREAYLTNTCIEIGNKAKTFIDKQARKILPEKELYLRQLYELMGLVHLDCYRLKKDENFDAVTRINFLFGLPIARAPSQDSVIKQNIKKFVDTNQAILVVEKRLANVTTPLETIWIYYDLARFNLDVKKYDLSRFYARKALNMSLALNNNVWATNVSLMITSSHVRQRNRNEAKNELHRTLEFALPLKYNELIAYINLCINVVETIDFENICADKVVQQREEEISKALIDKDTKQNIQVLFMRMDVIPPGRRMSIMPGVRFEAEHPAKKLQSKPSILAKSQAELEFQSQLSVKKGLELLED